MKIDPFVMAGISIYQNTGADAVLVEVDSVKDMEKIQEFASSNEIATKVLFHIFSLSSKETVLGITTFMPCFSKFKYVFSYFLPF